jgi:adenylate cyclase
MTTVVFADLVGSTSLFERLGDAAASQFVTRLTGALRQIFEQHHGRIVKLLGDGLFVVFEAPVDAVAASVRVQKYLDENPLHAASGGVAAQMQIGIAAGEVIEIDGDCFGDTVNCAARLADLASAAQILSTQTVWDGLLPAHRLALRSIGPMYLRGRSDATQVYRVEWQSGRDEDATLAGRSMFADRRKVFLELVYGGQTLNFDSRSGSLILGRSSSAVLQLNDPRVSRIHATLEWRGGSFTLTDTSTAGTWVYFGNQSEALILRRTECHLVGHGQIVAGCDRTDPEPPLVAFSMQA